MKKVKRVKIKIKFKNIMVFFIVAVSLIGFFYVLLNKKINNIYINGNKVLKEQEVLELIDFDGYLKFYQIDCNKLEKRLKTSPIVKKAEVSKSFLSLKINIVEYKTMWYQEYDDTIMLSNGKSVNLSKKILGIPSLINEIDDKYKQSFIDKLSKVDDNVFAKISEISYEPSEVDKERFLLYMNDQNYVYINLSRMNYLNKYDDLMPELENKKGILYLDSGNHFEIKK